MTFLRPESIWLLPIAIVLVAIARRLRRKRFVAFTTLRLLDPRLYRASRLRRLPALVLILALACLAAALMEPVLPYSEAQVTSLGLDLVVVLDLSSSMEETMGREQLPASAAQLSFTTRSSSAIAQPRARTRLEVTRDAIREFISLRRDDRIGLVVFSDNAYVVSPLTFDHQNLQQYIQMVDFNILRGEGMTAIGEGVTLANYLLARQSKRTNRGGQVIVVFTDGENNYGRNPLEALQDSNGAGIKVHLVGVDLQEEIKVKPDVQRLVNAVRRYGGEYYEADTTRQLRAASRAIDALEKGFLTNKVYLHNSPVFEWFAIPALVLIGVAFGLRAVPYFIDLT